MCLPLGDSLDAAISDPCDDDTYGVEPCAEPMTCEMMGNATICVDACHELRVDEVYPICDEASQDCYLDSNGPVCR